MENKLVISPKTKVLQLIETYPELEDVLIEYVPAFKKLKNPVLRKTVAKIATLQQASVIGNVKIEELINTLRKAVGEDLISIEDNENYNTIKPEWFEESKILHSIDIREMLNRGEQPVNQVITELTNLSKGEIYKVISPFIPAPLIDKASSLEIKHWIDKKEEEVFEVYFIR
ncbi:MAG: DUF1858 domain-containing protein [Bacteroidales bacterium]|jgi:hypothetical protein|nr:DUF1858 domain-containing protein [Bacteroidales bacterium]